MENEGRQMPEHIKLAYEDAVQNVMFYEIVGPRMAGVILGLSFIVHQIGSAGGPMLASIAFDLTGS